MIIFGMTITFHFVYPAANWGTLQAEGRAKA